MAVPVYIPIGNVQEFPFAHNFTNTFIFLKIVILTDVRWYLIVILISISLMINDVEHLFMYLFVIFISSFKTYLFRSLPVIFTYIL